jgi:molybdopterin molybdotransferase
VERIRVPDDRSKSIEAVRNAFRKADLLLVSGGISVGDRDHVKDALLENGVEELFHKVAQKPGKPLFFGKKGGEGKAVFGLPGNPAASLVSGYRYVLPYLRACSGWKDPLPPRFHLPIEEAWPKSSDRTVFLKAELTGDGVRPLGGQSSAMLQSFAEADALIRLPPRRSPVEKGELVEVELLEL